MKSKLREGQEVYFTNNYGSTDIGTIKKLNVPIVGSEQLGRKYVDIITNQYISGLPKCVTVAMSNIRPIL